MSGERKAKRFWQDVSVQAGDGGYEIALDGRRVRTPAKAPLTVPTRGMADAVAAEWDAQQDHVDPRTMPFTRSANAAIDKVAHQRAEVAEMLAGYGDSDLLCYRAEGPQGLVDRQRAQWDPLLTWAASDLGARLIAHDGIVHKPQAPDALEKLRNAVHGLDAFQLAGFHDLVSLSGSLIIGFAVVRGWRDPDTLWKTSRLDELWQEEQWGQDEQAQAEVEVKRQAFLHAKRFFDLSR